MMVPDPAGATAATTPHPLATEQARAVLADDGSAIEALVAAGAVLAVAYPHMCGLGGDAVWLVTEPDGATTVITGFGQAAADPGVPPVPLRGPGSALTAAGAVDSWWQAHAHSRTHWRSTRPWAALLGPAAALAREGAPVTASQHYWHTQRRDLLRTQPGFGAVFEPDGRVPDPGTPLPQPALAETLDIIARDGGRAFYEGPLADRIADGLGAAGAPLTAADLAGCRARIEQPLAMAYRGGTLLAAPPPSQGAALLQIMGLFERAADGPAPPERAGTLHVLARCVAHALADRDRVVADPDATGSSPPDMVATMLDARVLDRRAADIGGFAPAARMPQADTVWLAATDRTGRSACLMQSLYFDFGSGVIAGDTGVLWHNRGAAFSADTDAPNALRPGRRPLHTLTPVAYRRDGRLQLLAGTQGGNGQAQTVAQLLWRVIDLGLAPSVALARPRFLLGPGFEDSRQTLKLEADFGEAVIAELERRGHPVETVPARNRMMGEAGLLQLTGAGPRAAHDPRGPGTAALA
ncbi:gamma-glutamyltransferase [Algiphilus sp.]|uniref:gamma-glutamyltransferase family protein n=1 Tax=Algiphilus sp. TaxID=1872431 RepID=UPI0025BA04BE|nr:gamma-glutamyltransferase [Algiphilus sp.]MCK5768732.1 gamma-glutamyltransferase [Algiphilus sp.]